MNFIVPGSTSWCLRYDAEHGKKHATKHLWTYLLNKYIFPGEEWVVSTGKPPARHEDLHRSDILVEHCQDSELHVFLVCQKHCGPVDSKVISDMERKAYKRSMAYLMASGRDAVWALTCWGPFFRIWVCRRHGPSHLEPFYPQWRRGHSPGAYLDIKYATAEFHECFDFMKRHKRPRSTILTDLRNANKVSNAVYLSALGPGTYHGESGPYYAEKEYTEYASPLDLSGLPSYTLQREQMNPSDRPGVLDYLEAGESSGQVGECKQYTSKAEPTTASQSTGDLQGDVVSFWVQVTKIKSKRSVGAEKWSVNLTDGVTMMTEPHQWTKVCDVSETYWAWRYGRVWYYTRFAD